MAVKIEFETSNAAFAENDVGDLLYVMREIGLDLQIGKKQGTVRDSNGNRIGSWEATIDADETSE